MFCDFGLNQRSTARVTADFEPCGHVVCGYGVRTLSKLKAYLQVKMCAYSSLLLNKK